MAREINPEDFITWLTTQRNANGTLYLERVARHYARHLKIAPPKLHIPLMAEERFEVSVEDLLAKVEDFKSQGCTLFD